MPRFRRRFYRRPRPYGDPYAVPPPTVDPYAVVEERVEERDVVGDAVPRPPAYWRADNPWFWLALLGVLAILVVLVVLLAAAADDDDGTRTLTVSAQGVSVPSVIGLNYVDAGRTVDSAGLVADTFPVASGETLGTVVAQAPDAGTTLQPGEGVRLDVALGTESAPAVVVPDVTGPAAVDARSLARQAGFTTRTLYREAPSAEEEGEVILQRPRPGRSATQLTQITLYVGT